MANTYYVRSDGTRTAKNDALIGGSAGAALSVAGFNAETFTAGDTIIFESDGTYTSEIDFGQVGAAGAPITIQGPSVGNPAIVSVSGSNGITVTGNYLDVRNFHVTANSDKCFFISTSSGELGDGFTVRFLDCVAVENGGGDGFGSATGEGDDSMFECIRCQARAITGSGNQGYTCHSAQKMRLTDCTTTPACQDSVTAIGNELIINGGSFAGFGDQIVVTSGCVATVNNASFTCNGASGSIFDVNDTSTVDFNGCTITFGASCADSANIKADDVRVTFRNCTLTFGSAAVTSYFEYTSDGTLEFINCTLNVGTIGARLWRNVAAGGGNIRLIGCVVDMTEFGGASTQILFEWRSTVAADSATNLFAGNAFIGNDNLDIGNSVFRFQINTTPVVKVGNNTFYNLTGTNSEIFLDETGSATADIQVYNNIFFGCTDAFAGTDSITKDNNVYTDGTPDESDTNGYTGAPAFVNAAGKNLRLASTSLYRDGGRHWWGSESIVDPDGAAFRKDGPGIGAYAGSAERARFAFLRIS